MHALGVEGEGFGLAFGALRREFLVVHDEAHSRGVADLYNQFARGVESGRGGGDQRLPGDVVSVGGDRDPGVFAGADDQSEPDHRFLGGSGSRIAVRTDGYVIVIRDLDCVRVLLRFRWCRRARCGIGWRRSCLSGG